jgi:uncharacterized protein YfaS (alpha-2-macroglobulin family)
LSYYGTFHNKKLFLSVAIVAHSIHNNEHLIIPDMKKLFPCLLVLMALLFSCGRGENTPLQEVKPEFSKYVNSFTRGDYLSKGTRFIIRLAEPAFDSVQVGEKLASGLFEFKPSVSGEAYWVDQQTIEFIPDEYLESNTIYKVMVHLHTIMELPKELQTMEYEVKTIEQALHLGQGILNTYPNEMKFFQYENVIRTADIATNEEIEKVVKASFSDKAIRLKWTHDESGKIHRFVMDSIPRQKGGKMLQVKLDASLIDAGESESIEHRIPGIDEFEVLNVTTQMGESQSITIRFSDPLNQEQDVDGLVYLKSGEVLTLSVSGNTIVARPRHSLKGDKDLVVYKSIRNAMNYTLKNDYETKLKFESLKPAVKLIGEGTIMPSGEGGLIFPFEAVSLKAVDLRIIQIYENNVMFFLQQNNINDYGSISRVGRLVTQKRINLMSSKKDPNIWNSYKIDLADYVELQAGAIYRVELSFRRAYSLYSCAEDVEIQEPTEEEYQAEVDRQMKKYDEQQYYYYDDYYWEEDYYYDYNYRDRDNPCTNSYYRNGTSVSKNVFVSDIGIVAKASPTDQYVFAVSNIKSAQPISGAEVTLYNFQQQKLISGRTDGDGYYQVDLKKKPFFAVVKHNGQTGYLKLGKRDALSTSNFNVSGIVMQDGMKGYIYGERGVWRPGDKMFITFILEDEYGKLPKNYPVKFSLYNPNNQLMDSRVVRFGLNGFYAYHTQTDPDALTGNWNLVIKAGGATFSRTIKVEAIKPNRLRAKIEFDDELVTREDLQKAHRLQAQWLHGAPAKGLKYDVKAKFMKMTTKFKNYNQYNFDDVTTNVVSGDRTISSGILGEEGWKDLSLNFGIGKAPGFVKAVLTTRVFEKGGDFSILTQAINYSHYKHYVGARIQTKGNRGWYNIKKEQQLGLVVVDDKGKAVSNKHLIVKIYKVSWRWWWQSYNDLANYMRHRSTSQVFSTEAITSSQGKATVKFKLPYSSYRDNGRYLIVVQDMNGEHQCAFTSYFSEWYGRIGGAGEGATILSLTSDKDEYQVAEEAEIVIPSSAGSEALVSIEKGSEILDVFRVKTEDNETRFKVNITPEMAPGIYVYVTLIQPHAQTINDNPIRMYGVIPLDVVDPNTKLKPIIQLPKELEPEKEFTVNVKESDGKAMTYTLAIVDEGLLDLTGFQTPNPWPRFYSREMLLVRTWDMYNHVIGAFGQRLENALSIGGGDKVMDPSKSKTQRFKPVVLFSGPHHLEAGKNAKHTFTMPNYIGSVRVMVVAGENGAYGNAEKAVPVKKDVMLLTSLPRVLGPGEHVDLPVTVFAMDAKIKSVKVKVSTNSMLEMEEKTKVVKFDKPGEKIIYFPMDVALQTGVAKVKVEATGGQVRATENVELIVRNPNLPQTLIRDTVLAPGKSWKLDYKAFGIKGTNSASMEFSSLMPINLKKRIDYLIHYPYGCIEQTTSAVFPQLYLSYIAELSTQQKMEIEQNIIEALDRLRSFQLPNGGFSYWPGGNSVNYWGTNYAGHFLLEAKAKGYKLPSGMLKAWKKFQSNTARNWNQYTYRGSELEQAYRLYLLSKSGSPETSAMNRLRERKYLSGRAKTMLAGAFAFNRQKVAAQKLLDSPLKVRYNNTDYEYDYTFGSDLRDNAIEIIIYSQLKRNTSAFVLLQKVARQLSDDQWMSTQTTAFCLMAVADYFNANKDEDMKFNLKLDGKSESQSTEKFMFLKELEVDDLGKHHVVGEKYRK